MGQIPVQITRAACEGCGAGVSIIAPETYERVQADYLEQIAAQGGDPPKTLSIVDQEGRTLLPAVASGFVCSQCGRAHVLRPEAGAPESN